MTSVKCEPHNLSREELVGLVEGLREMMYGDSDASGKDVWNPDLSVSGAELVAWVNEEMTRLGLVPEQGRK